MDKGRDNPESGGEKPRRRLTLSRDSLRGLGDAALAKAAGGMWYYGGGGGGGGGGYTAWPCGVVASIVVSLITSNITPHCTDYCTATCQTCVGCSADCSVGCWTVDACTYYCTSA